MSVYAARNTSVQKVKKANQLELLRRSMQFFAIDEREVYFTFSTLLAWT
jgi:hypothetical protein